MWLAIIIGVPIIILGAVALGDWLLKVHERNEEKKKKAI
jgi:hypothetical protein